MISKNICLLFVFTLAIEVYALDSLAEAKAKEGQCDPLLSNPGVSEEILKDLEAIEETQSQFKDLVTLTTRSRDQSFKTRNQSTKQLVTSVKRFALREDPVLIIGETGTGKELIASAIHEHSKRRSGPFQVVNFGALNDLNFAKSELFGHDKGAYTDAKKDRAGKVAEANGGTLFLDEIGNIRPELWGMLLRLLENQTYSRLGSDVVNKADVRIIAATNKNLEDMVQKGLFPADLYFRLNVLNVELSPLRERPEDLEYLATTFLHKLTKEDKRPDITISNNAMEALKRYPWPGNVRELKGIMARIYANIDTDTTHLAVEHLPTIITDTTRWPTLNPQQVPLLDNQGIQAIPSHLDLTFPNQPYTRALARFLRIFLLSSLEKKPVEHKRGCPCPERRAHGDRKITSFLRATGFFAWAFDRRGSSSLEGGC